MNKIRIFVFIFLQFICFNLFSGGDSLAFIEDIKRFAFKEIGVEIKGELFTKWNPEEKPYVYLYVSLPDKVEKPSEISSSFIFCGTDQNDAEQKASAFKNKGYHTFCYKTNANSAALLNKRLMSYSKDAIAFIIFHELMHNYIFQENLKIPYEFNEAFCDVMGNYGALKYLQSVLSSDTALAKKQITSNEKIYKNLNKTISEINENPQYVLRQNERCNKIVNKALKDANLFQRDRFDFNVNNAYLLKNEYYSKNYFLLKKVFLKQKSIKDFIGIIKAMPENPRECEKFLEGYT